MNCNWLLYPDNDCYGGLDHIPVSDVVKFLYARNFKFFCQSYLRMKTGRSHSEWMRGELSCFWSQNPFEMDSKHKDSWGISRLEGTLARWRLAGNDIPLWNVCMGLGLGSLLVTTSFYILFKIPNLAMKFCQVIVWTRLHRRGFWKCSSWFSERHKGEQYIFSWIPGCW